VKSPGEPQSHPDRRLTIQRVGSPDDPLDSPDHLGFGCTCKGPCADISWEDACDTVPLGREKVTEQDPWQRGATTPGPMARNPTPLQATNNSHTRPRFGDPLLDPSTDLLWAHELNSCTVLWPEVTQKNRGKVCLNQHVSRCSPGHS